MINKNIFDLAPYDWNIHELKNTLESTDFNAIMDNDLLILYEALIYKWCELNDDYVLTFAEKILPLIADEYVYRAIYFSWVRARGFDKLKYHGIERLKSLPEAFITLQSESFKKLFHDLLKYFEFDKEKFKMELGDKFQNIF